MEFDVDAKGAVVHDRDTLDKLAPSVFAKAGQQRFVASESELVITQEEVETTRTIDDSFAPNVRLSELTTKQLEEALVGLEMEGNYAYENPEEIFSWNS